MMTASVAESFGECYYDNMDSGLVAYAPGLGGMLEVHPTLNLNLISPGAVVGAISRLITEIVIYRRESKLARIRLEEIRSRAIVAHQVIDAATRLELHQLALKQEAINRAVAIAMQSLKTKAQAVDVLVEQLRITTVEIDGLIARNGDPALFVSLVGLKSELAGFLTELTIVPNTESLWTISALERIVTLPANELAREIRQLERGAK